MIGQNCDGSLQVTMTGSSTGDSLSLDFTANHIYCATEADGSIEINVSGGNPDYIYSWSELNFDNTANQNNLSVGTYGITVTDEKDCLNTELIDIVILNPENDTIPLVDESLCGACTLYDGASSYFYGGGQFMAHIEDVSNGQSLGYTSVCTELYDEVETCLDEPFLPRTWTIESGADLADVTLYFTNEEFQALIDESSYTSILDCLSSGGLCISSYSGGAETCDDYVTTQTFSIGNGDFVITENDPSDGVWSIELRVGGFSTFYVHLCEADGGGTLPLQLIGLHAREEGDKNLIHWTTSNEILMEGFEVERSGDGHIFKSLAKVTAKNKAENSYTIYDDTPINGHNYYRIKMIDQNGSISYSHVVQVNRYYKTDLNILPNPFVENVQLEIYTAQPLSTKVYVYDMRGRLVFEDELYFDIQQRINALDFSDDMKVGVYNVLIINAENGNIINTSKIVKLN